MPLGYALLDADCRRATPPAGPDRDRDPLRDAPPRGRLAAGADGGGRRRAVRRQVPRRRPGAEGAGGGAGRGRARAGAWPAGARRSSSSSSTQRSGGPSRTRRSRSCSCAAPGSTSVSTSCPARCRSTRPPASGPGRPSGPGPRRRHRLVRRPGHERRPDRAQRQPARLASPAVAHRPWRRALRPAHLARPGRARPAAVRADRRPRAAALCRLDRRRRPAPRRAGDGRRCSSAIVAAIPDAWLGRAAAEAQGRAYVDYLRPASRRRVRSSRRPSVPAARRKPVRVRHRAGRAARRAGRAVQRGDRPPLAARGGSSPRWSSWTRPSCGRSPRAAIRPRSWPISRPIPRIAAGDPTAGPIAAAEPAERFHWLVAPAQHDRPAVAGPHRADRRPGRHARSPLRDARPPELTPARAPDATRGRSGPRRRPRRGPRRRAARAGRRAARIRSMLGPTSPGTLLEAQVAERCRQPEVDRDAAVLGDLEPDRPAAAVAVAGRPPAPMPGSTVGRHGRIRVDSSAARIGSASAALRRPSATRRRTSSNGSDTSHPAQSPRSTPAPRRRQRRHVARLAGPRWAGRWRSSSAEPARGLGDVDLPASSSRRMASRSHRRRIASQPGRPAAPATAARRRGVRARARRRRCARVHAEVARDRPEADDRPALAELDRAPADGFPPDRCDSELRTSP